MLSVSYNISRFGLHIALQCIRTGHIQKHKRDKTDRLKRTQCLSHKTEVAGTTFCPCLFFLTEWWCGMFIFHTINNLWKDSKNVAKHSIVVELLRNNHDRIFVTICDVKNTQSIQCLRPIIFVNVFRPYDMTPTNLVVWLKTDWRVTGSVDQWKKISQQWHWGVNDGRNMIVGSRRSQRSGIPGITTIFTILNISSAKCFQIEFCKTPLISNDRPLLRE